jgi:hypothetical protein
MGKEISTLRTGLYLAGHCYYRSARATKKNSPLVAGGDKFPASLVIKNKSEKRRERKRVNVEEGVLGAVAFDGLNLKSSSRPCHRSTLADSIGIFCAVLSGGKACLERTSFPSRGGCGMIVSSGFWKTEESWKIVTMSKHGDIL